MHFIILFQLLVLNSVFEISGSRVSDFNGFKSCFRDSGISSKEIVTRDNSSSVYSFLNHQWQTALPQIYPLAYVLVETEQDILATVRWGRRHHVRLVPKSGGHSFEKYSFGDADSVVMDFRKMTSVNVNRTTLTAEVGPGTLLGPLQWQLWEAVRGMVPVGTAPTVGISGLATGGGHGAFTRKYGLTLDHILEMNIVTAEGVLRTVNKDTLSDLFWALRGGGGASFGIITKFILNVHNAPRGVFEGKMTFNISQFELVYPRWQEIAISGPRKVMSLMFVDSKEIGVTVWVSSGEESVFQNIASNFPSPVSKSGHAFTYPQFLLSRSGEEFPGKSYATGADLASLKPESSKTMYIDSKAFFVTRVLCSTDLRRMQALILHIPSTVGCYFDTYGGAVDDIGETETAFIHRKGRIASVGVDFFPSPNDTDSNERGSNWQHQFFNLANSLLYKHETYQNYPNRDLKDYAERYYGVNLPRLVQVKRKYDPDNYFHNPQSIPFTLP